MARTSSFTKGAAWTAGIIGVMVIAGAIIGQNESDDRKSLEAERRAAMSAAEREAEDAERLSREQRQAAKGACRIAVQKSLHDPRSVQWDETPGWYMELRNDGSYLFQPRARARNAFGALVHGVWECVAMPDGDQIRITSLKQIGP